MRSRDRYHRVEIRWPDSPEWPGGPVRFGRRRWPWEVAYDYLVLVGRRVHRGGWDYRP